MSKTTSRSRVLTHIAVASSVAPAWIIAALFYRHSADTDPQSVRLALSAMAFWFLACGIWAYGRIQSPASFRFLVYAALSAVHWGGPVGIGSPALQNIELAVFIVFASLLTQAIFLDLVRQLGLSAKAPNPPFWRAPYAPVIAGLLLLILFVFQPDNQSMLESFMIFYTVGILLSLIGGVILIRRPFVRKDNRFADSIVAAALIAGWAPHALVTGGLIPATEYAGFYSLPLAIIPLALAWRISKSA